MRYGVLPGAADTYHYGEALANVSNTRFREYKHWVHEGGISTPLIALGPPAFLRLATMPWNLNQRISSI
jgi:arylsulfatase